MNLFLTIVALVGWYFVLGMFPSLRSSVAFTAMNTQFTWFSVLFVLGALGITKLTLSK